MARRRKGRAIDGILVLDKPLGLSSNHALQKVRGIFQAAKGGHTGSLDPLATGVLPICLGEATKFTQFLLDADKEYEATVRFGAATSSGDCDGDILHENGADTLSEAVLEEALVQFRGEIDQIPSMYSALKHQGQPLYKLARAGQEVERKARSITIHGLKLLAFREGQFPEADIAVRCTKGTYIRTLAEDIGEYLGCGGYVTALRRTGAGPFNLGDAATLPDLQALRDSANAAAVQGDTDFSALDRLLLPLDAGIQHMIGVVLPDGAEDYFMQGQSIMVPQLYRHSEEGDIVRVFQQASGSETDCLPQYFLGVAEVTDDGRVAPKRLVVRSY